MSCNFTQLNVVPRAGLYGNLQCLAQAHSPEPEVHLAHSHFQQPATIPVIIHEVPMP